MWGSNFPTTFLGFKMYDYLINVAISWSPYLRSIILLGVFFAVIGVVVTQLHDVGFFKNSWIVRNTKTYAKLVVYGLCVLTVVTLLAVAMNPSNTPKNTTFENSSAISQMKDQRDVPPDSNAIVDRSRQPSLTNEEREIKFSESTKYK